jgi:hypothetical protein
MERDTTGKTSIGQKVHPRRNEGPYMQWEYKFVALGLLVDATEQHQREKHEQILNDLSDARNGKPWRTPRKAIPFC